MIKNRARSWVTCPIGINLLLALLKGSKLEKYNQINCQLQKKAECYFESKLFAKSSKKISEVLISEDVEILENPMNALIRWAENNKLALTKKLKRDISEESDFILAHICTFKGFWETSTDAALMKVYNSFNYTQDIKYEARLLELPLKEDLKFVIIVPNENDVLQSLFQKLVNEGLTSAARSIQPVFIASSEVNAPRIRFDSEAVLKVDNGKMENIFFTQFGYVDVNDKGIHIEVITCIYTGCYVNNPLLQDSVIPFFFGLVYEDMPIFIGQFFPDN